MAATPDQILALLVAGYPVASPAWLARAMTTHAGAFAGIIQAGRYGDVLVWPDGDAYDVIFSVNSSVSRWQMLYLDPTAPPPPEDPWALEEGPIAYLDPGLVPSLDTGPPIEATVAPYVGQLLDAEAAVLLAGEPVGAILSEPDLAARADQDLQSLMDGLGDEDAHLYDLRPEALVVEIDGQRIVVDFRDQEVPDPGDPNNPYAVPEPDPGQPREAPDYGPSPWPEPPV